MFRDERCYDMNNSAMTPAKDKKDKFEHFDIPQNMPNMNYQMPNMNCPMPGMVCPPIYECPQERCCHREIVHEMPQE